MAKKERASPPRAGSPERITCSVCQKSKPASNSKGAAYWTAPNGEPICFGCLDQADAKAINEGRITLNLVYDRQKNRWSAQNMTGKFSFPLQGGGLSDASAVANPRFVDREGYLWKGRLYRSTGQAHFQRGKQPLQANAQAGGAPKQKRRKASPPGRRARQTV